MPNVVSILAVSGLRRHGGCVPIKASKRRLLDEPARERNRLCVQRPGGGRAWHREYKDLLSFCWDLPQSKSQNGRTLQPARRRLLELLHQVTGNPMSSLPLCIIP